MLGLLIEMLVVVQELCDIIFIVPRQFFNVFGDPPLVGEEFFIEQVYKGRLQLCEHFLRIFEEHVLDYELLMRDYLV